MNSDSWVIVPLAPVHERASFDCGTEELNRYLREQAGQNAKQDISRTYVAALAAEPQTIGGYYTLTLRSLGFQELPKEKRLPHYPTPLVHLGRLAVSVTVQGQGLGKRLLLDALRRALSLSEEAGGYAVEVFALNEPAARFYAHYGFVPVDEDNPRHLYLTMKAIRKLGLSPSAASHPT